MKLCLKSFRYRFKEKSAHFWLQFILHKSAISGGKNGTSRWNALYVQVTKKGIINFLKFYIKEISKMGMAKNFKHISKLMKLSWILKRLRLGRVYIVYACTASKFKLICGDPKGRVIIGFHFNFPGLYTTCCVDSGWMSRQKTRKYLPFFTRTVF